jgi:hypothetical protein
MAALQLNSRRGGDGRDHVPYRESRLTRLLQVGAPPLVPRRGHAPMRKRTRLGPCSNYHGINAHSTPPHPTPTLQDSLGGNAYIAIVACISGEPGDMEETLLTLKYAAGARRIRGAPTLTKKVGGRGLVWAGEEKASVRVLLWRLACCSAGVRAPGQVC